MAIIDQFGNPYAQTAARGAVRYSGMRPWEPVQLRDIGKLVPAYDRSTLLSASRRLFLNEDILRGATEQKAMYAIGTAWRPKFTGQDRAWGEKAQKWLEEEWFQICDVRGDGFDFWTKLFLWSVGIDRDGETFELLTETKDGYPKVQSIPCHRINTPRNLEDDNPIPSGPYRNAKICDGIAYNRQGTPIAAAYTDEDGNLIEWLSFRDCFQICDRAWQEQGRGLPAFTPALNGLRDALQSHEWEQLAQLQLSSISIIEKNSNGGPDPNDPSSIAARTAAGSTGGAQVETFAGGTVRYILSGSGGDITTLKNDRPGDAWESFHDRIIRKALAGVNWPYSMVWKNSGQGTAERNDISKAQRAVDDRQGLINRPARRVTGYGISKAIKLGILPESPDWNCWEFSMPSKLTIDDGRVAKELVLMWKSGHLNQTDILGMLGKTPEQHYEERAAEIYARKSAAKRWSKDGIEIDDREMAMLTENDQPEKEPVSTSPTEEE